MCQKWPIRNLKSPKLTDRGVPHPPPPPLPPLHFLRTVARCCSGDSGSDSPSYDSYSESDLSLASVDSNDRGLKVSPERDGGRRHRRASREPGNRASKDEQWRTNRSVCPPPGPVPPSPDAHVWSAAIPPSWTGGCTILTPPRPPSAENGAERRRRRRKGQKERIIVVVRSPRQETYPPDAHPSAHMSVLESANPRMDSEGASGCTWSTARATARLRDSRPPE